MTYLEATERAVGIWGRERLQHVQLRPDGGADVLLYAEPTNPDPVRQFGYHRLDANGHVACHSDCLPLEQGLL
jgi:hypothetical protein